MVRGKITFKCLRNDSSIIKSYFINEYDAHNAYQNKLKNITIL